VTYNWVVLSNTTIGTADRWQKRTGNEIEPPSQMLDIRSSGAARHPGRALPAAAHAEADDRVAG